MNATSCLKNRNFGADEFRKNIYFLSGHPRTRERGGGGRERREFVDVEVFALVEDVPPVLPFRGHLARLAQAQIGRLDVGTGMVAGRSACSTSSRWRSLGIFSS